MKIFHRKLAFQVVEHKNTRFIFLLPRCADATTSVRWAPPATARVTAPASPTSWVSSVTLVPWYLVQYKPSMLFLGYMY